MIVIEPDSCYARIREYGWCFFADCFVDQYGKTLELRKQKKRGCVLLFIKEFCKIFRARNHFEGNVCLVCGGWLWFPSCFVQTTSKPWMPLISEARERTDFFPDTSEIMPSCQRVGHSDMRQEDQGPVMMTNAISWPLSTDTLGLSHTHHN